jgi:hypothetical protein
MFRDPTPEEKRRYLATLTFGPLAIFPAACLMIAIDYISFNNLFDYSGFNNIFDFFLITFSISTVGLLYGYFFLAFIGLPLTVLLCRNKKPSFLFVVFETIFICSLIHLCFSERSLGGYLALLYYGLSVASLSWYIYVKK